MPTTASRKDPDKDRIGTMHFHPTPATPLPVLSPRMIRTNDIRHDITRAGFFTPSPSPDYPARRCIFATRDTISMRGSHYEGARRTLSNHRRRIVCPHHATQRGRLGRPGSTATADGGGKKAGAVLHMPQRGLMHVSEEQFALSHHWDAML